jgi:pimeloyl-ACP methyl ester carboxylesterase
VQGLLQKVTVRPDDRFTASYPSRFPSRVTVRLKNGQSCSQEVSDYPGFASRPFTWNDIDAKFDRLAAGHVSGQLGQAIKHAVRSLENTRTSDLMKLLGDAKQELTDEGRAKVHGFGAVTCYRPFDESGGDHEMNRRDFSATLLAAAAGSLTSKFASAAHLAPTKAHNVVLVHGLFADGSSWSEVIPRLQAAGLNVTSVQNPLTTLPEAVAAALRVLARQDGPTVLAGHSFSGMIVTDAGVHPNVSAVVYVAARAPDAGEDYTALAKRFPTPPASAGILFDGDEGRLSEDAFLRDFAADLPEARAKALYAVQWPFQKELLAGKTTHAAWRSKPSWYAVSTEDRVINPDLERFMAKRMDAKTIEVKASHVSLISHPEAIANLIFQATGRV